MAYHGLIPSIKQFLLTVPHQPRLLEVGVDRGVTFVTLVNFLARSRENFFALGIDVKVQEQVSIMLQHADLTSDQVAILSESNSLISLPELISRSIQFDVILLDGDHNYHTVSREMPLVTQLLAPNGMLVVDDYDGKWGRRDMWYAERSGYEDNVNVTARVASDKSGVGSAVDDWLGVNPGWVMTKPVYGEPVVIRRSQ